MSKQSTNNSWKVWGIIAILFVVSLTYATFSLNKQNTAILAQNEQLAQVVQEYQSVVENAVPQLQALADSVVTKANDLSLLVEDKGFKPYMFHPDDYGALLVIDDDENARVLYMATTKEELLTLRRLYYLLPPTSEGMYTVITNPERLDTRNN
jgi:hypothetical protein